MSSEIELKEVLPNFYQYDAGSHCFYVKPNDIGFSLIIIRRSLPNGPFRANGSLQLNATNVEEMKIEAKQIIEKMLKE